MRPPAIPKKIPIALPRSRTGKAEITIASAAGNISAAPAPSSTRKKMIQASAYLPSGVSPHAAEAITNTITPITTMVRCPTTSASRPPSANRAESASRYPLTTHWSPVEESSRSFCNSGAAIETIVMSMNVIETAKIIAASTRFLLGCSCKRPQSIRQARS